MSRQEDLEVFVKVVQSGSLAKAAEELQLNPSAVSRRISHLEKRLGVRLLNRTTRSLSLTEVGERYLNRCLRILEEIEEAEREAQQHSNELQGTLRISCSTYFAHRFLLAKISRFLKQNAQVSIELMLTDDVVDLVSDRIDVAIRIGELADPSLVAKKLISDRRILCASPQYLDRYGIPQTPDDLVHHRCLSLNAQKTTLNQWRFRDKSGLREIQVRGNFQVNSGQALYEVLLTGLGIGRVTQFLAHRELASGQLVRLLEEYEEDNEVGIYAVFPSRHYLLPKVQCFVEFLQKSLLHFCR
ncbi:MULTISPECIES: LysR family transcriptional regulator [unclassified Coleofasciculus]|uniref:LysR family transcriptional regulator n=1 Tax=unclassified Coleofasciculus TaxID=2692782 RepID=UPI001880177A|nr:MULTISPECIES: LysR family transcriptional regulator [unclassified Coleofasciculus]MBE9125016.1 LysR family transcriptional regulator [Coleofasciculus sp. LEGE 07081]MBE9147664.1 LysR family transcriptional regulator [Coleofasciculus sp. LEGE 07092]